ncbi:hypothetical protein GCM10022215_40620 [Nocardioides fonticola]|uniref:Uncharacterized protein n=1 Tax=Nocardioides fonticola TaxID=450363 RepID=A0ABP7Y045_9ACTN
MKQLMGAANPGVVKGRGLILPRPWARPCTSAGFGRRVAGRIAHLQTSGGVRPIRNREGDEAG